MTSEHIVSSFDEDLQKIEGLVLEMGGLVEQQMLKATDALEKVDATIAQQVIGGDKRINLLEADVNERVIKVLALRQPVASDLRAVVMTLRIAGHLERIGDYTKNIARRVNTISQADAFTGSVATLARMSHMVQVIISSALDAYMRRDPDEAENVRGEDANIDQMNNTLFRELLTYMMEEPSNISVCMHLLFIAKNLERIGDHAVEIAGETIYLVTGNWPAEKRPKGDRTSRMIVTPEELAMTDKDNDKNSSGH